MTDIRAPDELTNVWIGRDIYLVEIRRDQLTGVAWEERWLLGGQVHRCDGPASLKRDCESGVTWEEKWLLNGAIHRSEGPAWITRDRKTGAVIDESWFRNNVPHREDGPAVVCYDPTTGHVRYRAWYVNGQRIPLRLLTRNVRPRRPSVDNNLTVSRQASAILQS